MVTFGESYPDPGIPKWGRIVVDDGHSFEWEQAARRLDEDYYGDFSTYSYATMAEHLSRCYALTVATTSEALLASLRQCDVLILKTPEINYSEEERTAIRRFVADGGGLLAIGDHTNLMGMNAHLNSVVGAMGFILRDDSVRHSTDNTFVEATPPSLGRHPALAGTGPFLFMTGCSVHATDPETVAMTARDCVCDPADYLNSSYFPTWSGDPGTQGGRVPVVAAGRCGAGRVVVFSDGTPFSSFDYYKRGYPETMVAMLEWLDRRNGPAWVATLLLAVGVVVVALSLLAWCLRSMVGPVWVVALAAGAYAGLGAVSACGTSYYPAVREIRAPPEVGFVDAYSFATFPPSLGGRSIDERAAFDTLYNLPLRLGRRCRLHRSLGEALDGGGGTVVLVNVVDRPDAEALGRVADRLAQGLRMVVIQRAGFYGSPGSVALSAAVGLDLRLNSDRTPAVPTASVLPAPPGVFAFSKTLGRGGFVLVVSEDLFCNESLGHSMTVPSESERALHRFVLDLFRYEGPRWDRCLVRR